MKAFFFGLMAGVLLFPALANADEATDKAIHKDRQLITGNWTIVALTINGNKVAEEDARKLSVVNGPGDVWSLFSEGKEVGKGTNLLDPTKQPKTIDFTLSKDGKDPLYRGIYELTEDSRKLCFAPPDKERPKDFTSEPGSEYILVIFERVQSK